MPSTRLVLPVLALGLGASLIVTSASLTSAVTAAPASASLLPRTVSQTSTLAIIKTLAVGSEPQGIAVNDEDDTVYVTNWDGNTVSIINGRTGVGAGTIAVGVRPAGVAVNQVDDTVYVSNFTGGFDPSSDPVSVINGRTGTRTDDTIYVGWRPQGVAVNDDDDTVYVANKQSSTISVVNGRTGMRTDDTIYLPRYEPWGVAVNQSDDTVYVTGFLDGVLWVVNGRTRALDDTITVGGVGTRPTEIAINQADDTVYVINRTLSGNVSVINGRTGARDDTIPVGDYPRGVAVDQLDDTIYVTNDFTSSTLSVINGRNVDDSTTVTVTNPWAVAVDNTGSNAGLVYVSNYWPTNTVSVIGRVSPSLGASSGPAGSSLTLRLDVPQASYDVDDSTIAAVDFGGTPGTNLAAGSGDTWSVTVPAGTGTVPVTVTFNGGRTALAGDFTYGSAPTPPTPTPPTPNPPTPNPPEPTPASAPRDVVATAGDAEASVSWSAPASTGSYPISSYRVTSSSGGHGCLVTAPALTCRVAGLANGTTYTFTVAALTGAGWSAPSAASNAVTPRRAPDQVSITITGSRSGPTITVDGTTTGMAMGGIVRPWSKRGSGSFTSGREVLVSADGTFTWSRTATRSSIWSVYFTAEGARSNVVVLRR
jgi:YVTN family beta-propeller protein